MASDLNINTFDAVVVGIVGLSALVAFFRGFVRELLSLGAWVGAAIITLYLFPHSTEFMKNHIHGHESAPVAAGIGALGTYIAALIVISIINSIILKYLKTGAEVGLLDNFLGLLFGGLRGIFIVSLGYLIMASVVSTKDNQPEWLKGSVTKPYVEQSSAMLANVAPEYLHDVEGYVKEEQQKAKDDQNGTTPDAPSTGARSFKQIMEQPPTQHGSYGTGN